MIESIRRVSFRISRVRSIPIVFLVFVLVLMIPGGVTRAQMRWADTPSGNRGCPGVGERGSLPLDSDLRSWKPLPGASQRSFDYGLQTVMQARFCEKAGEINLAAGYYDEAQSLLMDSAAPNQRQQLITKSKSLRQQANGNAGRPYPHYSGPDTPANFPGEGLKRPDQPQNVARQNSTSRKETDAAMDQAMRLFDQKQYRSAVPYFSQVVQAEPENNKAWFYRGIARKLGGDPDITLSDLDIDRARQLNRPKAEWYTNMAAQYLAGRLVGPEGMEADWEKNKARYNCSGYIDVDAQAACMRGDITTANILRRDHDH